MEKLTILVDLDNTIYDLDLPWHSRYNKDYPHHILHSEAITDWDTSKFVAPECGSCIYKYLDVPEVYLEGAAFEGSVETTRDWVFSHGYEIIILTAFTSIEAVKPKTQWIKQNLSHIDSIILVSHKTKKSHIHADILIDDGLHNHESFSGVSILYDRPWNRSNTDLPRAHNWYEINSMVSAIDLLLSEGKPHKEVQNIIVNMFSEKINET
jgi:5'-nucleotidase